MRIALSTQKRLENLILGATFINFAVVHLYRLCIGTHLPDLVRLGTISCNLLMGISIIVSSAAIHYKSLFFKPCWLGMLICNILIVQNINESLGFAASILFALGLLVTICSLVNLGRSFALAPSLIELKTTFLYSYIRHPMYFGEMLMILACVVVHINTLSVLSFLTCIAFMVKRIALEEDMLKNDPRYTQYTASTKWRILPYIW